MFTKYHQVLDVPLEDLTHVFLAEPPVRWLPGLIQPTAEWQAALVAELGVKLGGHGFGAWARSRSESRSDGAPASPSRSRGRLSPQAGSTRRSKPTWP